ncbi:MAG: HPr family phosphocarrier protein [Oscillospiraceae bacterium]|jgi:phosphotransferase system HPr-like phosphotransfer protein|nr:HPr family phosphocarrier protein [Oscillospiraceae bacterium]
MYTTSILLSSIEAVKKFVTLTNSYNFPINLATDRYKIDAKSIMGVFSLDLSKPLKIEVDSSNADDFIRKIQQFQCNPVSVKS